MLSGTTDRGDRGATVVTGASSGIGKSTARALARRGRRVVATVRPTSDAEALRSLARDPTLSIVVDELDVDDSDSVEAFFRRVEEVHGGAECLVNNAGISSVGAVEETPLDVWHAVFETNVFGVVRCCRRVLPAMRSRGRGRIINVSSVAGRVVTPGQAAYTASKFALEGLSEALALEVASFGVDVVLVEPGVTVTPMLGKLTSAPPETPYEEVYARTRGLVSELLRSAAHPDEVASDIVDVVEADAPPLRWPTGHDTRRLLSSRSALSDEAWVALGAEQPDRFVRGLLGAVAGSEDRPAGGRSTR